MFAAVLGKSYNSYMHIGSTKDPTIYCFMGSKLRNRIPEDLLNCSPFMACRFYRLLGFWTTPAASNQQKYTYMYVLQNCNFQEISLELKLLLSEWWSHKGDYIYQNRWTQQSQNLEINLLCHFRISREYSTF